MRKENIGGICATACGSKPRIFADKCGSATTSSISQVTALGIVIELDGGQHALQSRWDEARTKFLESEGYRVLRFWNNDVLTNIDGVLEMIQNAILATPTPTPPHKGEGRKTGS